VRIRYPQGMSWKASGTLRLSGTPQAGVLSGRVTVDRVVVSQGFDFGGLLTSTKESGSLPSGGSSFLRNLQLDIETDSTPDSAIEWPGAHFEAESSLRVRGTFGHPVILGYIHLLSGEITFRGNRYELSRGDVNFSRAFSLDPDINIEATASIRQYEITLNFSGRASHLTLAYRSDPPLPSSDIITLMALGRTGEESQQRTSTSSSSLGGGASALLSEAISSQLGGRLERLFGVTRLRVDPMLGGSVAGQNAAARVSVEEQITRDLTITYISSAATTQQQVIQVEYNVSRKVSILALRDENGTFGLDIKIKKRFK
jgi:translocation and assembly module TamB